MILKKVKIYNYRQLQKVELDLQNSLTVLAGPNNSGKTTLISVLKGMFRDKKLSFTYSDIPTNLSTSWVEKIIPVFQSIMVENDKNTGISEIIKKISVDDKLLPEYTIECFHAEIQVDYDPTGDDIQLFADYLMDLDESKHSFYFIYSYEPSIASFEKYLGECYDKMSSRFLDISNPDCKEKETKLYFIKEELLKLYCHASLEKCYFCNSNYENANSIEIIAFKNLFNFRDIPAIRELDDHESDTSKGISKRIIALLKGNEKWEEVTKKLPDLLMAQIEDSGAKKEIKNSSIKSLDETVQDISKTSGGHIGKLQLEMDVNENVVEDFIQKITRAKYDIDGLLLNEQSQGLGFSNLIYLHMRLEEFYKSVDDSKVNVFFIEEPESHMHPQMQNVFIRFLTKYYTEKKLQGLITTHSNEIARSVGLNSLRVIRQTEKSKSELFNLSKFRKSIENKKVKNVDKESEFLLQNFFDWFFEIGYSELIFADKVILYEGDTERLYIRKLLGMTEFASLRDNYIAFIQVGGAYEESAEYQQVLNIEIAEIKNLANYLRTPYISTQHGVKGESHQSVVFVAADNYSTPNVRMYSFFELWSKNTFSLPEFEDLFYSYSKIIMEVEAKLRMKISDLTAETHNKNEANKKLLAEYSNQVLNTYRDNKLFEALLKDDFIAYLAKSTVGNAKNIFKISKIEGILTAYKLFYVGCSRARKNLVIVVDETKINKFENEFKAKLISIGFEIQGFPMQETATV